MVIKEFLKIGALLFALVTMFDNILGKVTDGVATLIVVTTILILVTLQEK